MNPKGLALRTGALGNGRQQGLSLIEVMLAIIAGISLLAVTIGIADWVKGRDHLRRDLDTVHLISQHIYDTHGWGRACGAAPCDANELASICTQALNGLPQTLRQRLQCGLTNPDNNWILEFRADRSYRIGLTRHDRRPFNAAQCVDYAGGVFEFTAATLHYDKVSDLITPDDYATKCINSTATDKQRQRLWVTLRW